VKREFVRLAGIAVLPNGEPITPTKRAKLADCQRPLGAQKPDNIRLLKTKGVLSDALDIRELIGKTD
jgi:hypothetical protein